MISAIENKLCCHSVTSIFTKSQTERTRQNPICLSVSSQLGFSQNQDGLVEKKFTKKVSKQEKLLKLSLTLDFRKLDYYFSELCTFLMSNSSFKNLERNQALHHLEDGHALLTEKALPLQKFIWSPSQQIFFQFQNFFQTMGIRAFF